MPPRPRRRRVGIALRAALLLLAACSAQRATALRRAGDEEGLRSAEHVWGRAATPRAGARALRAAEAAGSGSSDVELCCLEVELLSPYLAAGNATPSPGTRFDAAKARAVRCGPLRDCAGQATFVPTAELGQAAPSSLAADVEQRPFALTMRLAVPAAGAFTPAWPGKDEARAPPPEALAPRGTWTHFAGDSLLRGAFSTLTQWLRKARWEQWKGEAYFQAVFQCVPRPAAYCSNTLTHMLSVAFAHSMSRCLCCDDVARPDSCAFSLHNESSATLFAAARSALALGQTCVTYSFLMDYAAVTAQLQQMAAPSGAAAAAEERLPERLIVSDGLHTMRQHDAAFFKAEVARFLDEAATPRWRATAVVMHTVAAPNYTMVAAAGHKQSPAAVSSFNAALREAVDAAAAARGPAEAPRLVDLHAVTTEHRGGELAAHAQRRFPRLDALHFSDPFYQTAFVADALALAAAQRAREAAAKRQAAA